ncbi:hypothetical protein [uncultured Jatrophihabitans sp.]|uniref:hypothetical protein n=1 Tax=uncultured Jatrophihabitans sp. TaxID=1610747 RepID=UPI0035C9B000
MRISAGAILAVVAGSTLIAVLQHSDGHPSSAPASSAPPTPSADNVIARPSAAPRRTRELSIAVDCPVVDACRVSFNLPSAVTAALRARLHGADQVFGGSVLVRGAHPTLRSRQITARVGGLSVRIRIEPAADDERPSAAVTNGGDATIVSVTGVSNGLAVHVVVSGPSSAIPGLSTVDALARDPRLLAVS